MYDIIATLALGSSNSDQPLSKVATLAPKLAKPLGMAPPPLFLDPVSPIRINHDFVLFILVFCVNKVTQKLDFGMPTSLSPYICTCKRLSEYPRRGSWVRGPTTPAPVPTAPRRTGSWGWSRSRGRRRSTCRAWCSARRPTTSWSRANFFRAWKDRLGSKCEKRSFLGKKNVWIIGKWYWSKKPQTPTNFARIRALIKN